MQPDQLPASLPPAFAAITIMGSGRLGPTVSALIGLIGTVIGGIALSRANRRIGSDARGGAIRERTLATAALVAGAISVVCGGLFLATADGGPGTGNGVVGSVAALVLGVIAIVLGGLARTRRRQVHIGAAGRAVARSPEGSEGAAATWIIRTRRP
jgi:hypothetical protein